VVGVRRRLEVVPFARIERRIGGAQGGGRSRHRLEERLEIGEAAPLRVSDGSREPLVD
jgi:hypothetical protein